MDAHLVGILRERMSAKGDAELLRTWVENNRLQWSPECFEAIRLLLEDRRVLIPPQNDPPLGVLTGPPEEDDRWMRLLRPVLVFGLLLGALGVLHDAAPILFLPPDRVQVGAMTLLELSKSALLTIGAAGALYPRRRPVFRWMVVAYAWAAIGLSLLVGLGAALGAFRLARELDLAAAAYVYLGQLESSLLRMAYPAILLWIMARPTVKARYHGGHVMGQGFEPIWPSARSDG